MELQKNTKTLTILIVLCFFQLSNVFAQVFNTHFESIPQEHLLSPKNILITGWGDMALDAAYSNMVAHLESLGYAVTGSDTFPDDLTGFEILILVGGGMADEDIPEAVVDSFVHEGNGLIIMEGSSWSLDFDPTANSNPVENTTGWVLRDGCTVTMPGHALCQGLTTTCSFRGYSTQPTLKNGAVVPIEWDDGIPFAVTWTWGEGRVVYFNNLWIWYSGVYWRADPVNGQKLMENALEYLYMGEETGIDSDGRLEKEKVLFFRLEQNYPNPFNPSTTIQFNLLKSDFVSLRIYNLLGKEVETLFSEYRHAGDYEVEWNAEEFPSGIYLYRLEAGDFVETRKLILQK